MESNEKGKEGRKRGKGRGKGRGRAGRQISKVMITSNGQEGKYSLSSPQGVVYKMAIQMPSTRV